MKVFKCPACHRLSANMGDIINRYCSSCKTCFDPEIVEPMEVQDARGIPADALAIVDSHVAPIQGIFLETARRLDGVRWQHYLYPLTVISSASIEADGKRWLHVSFAHAKRMPTYDETALVKKYFIGETKYAVMVFPPKDFHVNLHPYCLHLWHCLDGHPLPEFSGMTAQGRSI